MSIPIPAVAKIQFVSQAGSFDLDTLSDPSGAPTDVFDIDLGFTYKGRIVLPGWMTGTGLVQLFAREIGGPFNGRIGLDSVALTGATSAHDPKNKEYHWTIGVKSPVLPDPSPGSGLYELGLSFIYQNPGGSHTDIGAFLDLGVVLVV